ncbi:unnamed protein product [Lactuca virosa]|uniref:RRM domain-containing protein n=1 Tax=Lactuca virosa TaxID=75947 RepID=A0AAU9NCT6_9ASTR|nr:unnamed protein product [Lactuca virosa]
MTYAGFGRLSDVYMANNRAKNGEYFAFIRFLGVEHAKMLERQLDGQTLRGRTLAVNLSLHERKEPTGRSNRNNSNGGRGNHVTPAVNKPARHTARTSLRDNRSYADLMKPVPTPSLVTHPPGPPLPTTITLYHELVTQSWLRKTTLVGEAVSLDHLRHLPKLLLAKGETGIEIKYLGGLMGDKTETYFERVAWIRIVGLPLQLWGEHNFNAISRNFGRTIAPYNDLPNRVDLSHAKLDILTTRRTRINEEIYVAFDGKVYTLGIIEFDQDWFPFRFDPSEDYLYAPTNQESNQEKPPVQTSLYENTDKHMREVNEERSEENMVEEMEEGEIGPETQYIDNETTNGSGDRRSRTFDGN